MKSYYPKRVRSPTRHGFTILKIWIFFSSDVFLSSSRLDGIKTWAASSLCLAALSNIIPHRSDKKNIRIYHTDKIPTNYLPVMPLHLPCLCFVTPKILTRKTKANTEKRKKERKEENILTTKQFINTQETKKQFPLTCESNLVPKSIFNFTPFF